MILPKHDSASSSSGKMIVGENHWESTWRSRLSRGTLFELRIGHRDPG